jgi:hypothetical protein
VLKSFHIEIEESSAPLSTFKKLFQEKGILWGYPSRKEAIPPYTLSPGGKMSLLSSIIV